MKTLLLVVSILLLQQTAYAQKSALPSEADYVVPTTADLVDHSRFKVKIHQAYAGNSSDTLAYTFPAELTGVENQVITLKRIGKTNTWESPEMTASCTESKKLFSCNIYLIKDVEPIIEKSSFPFPLPLDTSIVKTNNLVPSKAHTCGAVMAMSFVDPQNVENFLGGTMGFTGDELDKKLAVANSFACSEPAGILSYEFK